MRIEILSDAEDDLIAGARFYERQGTGLGVGGLSSQDRVSLSGTELFRVGLIVRDPGTAHSKYGNANSATLRYLCRQRVGFSGLRKSDRLSFHAVSPFPFRAVFPNQSFSRLQKPACSKWPIEVLTQSTDSAPVRAMSAVMSLRYCA